MNQECSKSCETSYTGDVFFPFFSPSLIFASPRLRLSPHLKYSAIKAVASRGQNTLTSKPQNKWLVSHFPNPTKIRPTCFFRASEQYFTFVWQHLVTSVIIKLFL